jgi:hypothetical protein
MDGNDKLLTEARSLVAEAASMGLHLRLMGGMAVRVLSPSSRKPPFARTCADLDFFSTASAAGLEGFFARRAWTPDTEFNLYNGSERLKFSHAGMGRGADIFLGRFRMCHEIRLGSPHAPEAITISPAELLLTKLQVVEANEKDLADAFCILADHGLGSSLDGDIDAQAFASACAGNWGLQKTIELSLDRLRTWIAATDLDRAQCEAVLGRIVAIGSAVRSEPKTFAWMLRSVVGTRVRWFDLPEEVER